MTTIADALQSAADRLDAATALMTAIRDQVGTQLASTTQTATTIINNFQNRAPSVSYFFDPDNGSDANDGQSLASPKKTLDAILDSFGNNAVQIFMLGDGLVRRRHYTYYNVAFVGIQRSNTPAGFSYANRNLTWLSTAENSPSQFAGSFCAGLFMSSAGVSFTSITVKVPDAVSGQNYNNFASASGLCGAAMINTTVTVGSANAGAVFGCTDGRLTASLTYVLGAGAAGHVFDGVAAGANPNAQFVYATNITSA